MNIEQINKLETLNKNYIVEKIALCDKINNK